MIDLWTQGDFEAGLCEAGDIGQPVFGAPATAAPPVVLHEPDEPAEPGDSLVPTDKPLTAAERRAARDAKHLAVVASIVDKAANDLAAGRGNTAAHLTTMAKGKVLEEKLDPPAAGTALFDEATRSAIMAKYYAWLTPEDLENRLSYSADDAAMDVVDVVDVSPRLPAGQNEAVLGLQPPGAWHDPDPLALGSIARAGREHGNKPPQP